MNLRYHISEGNIEDGFRVYNAFIMPCGWPSADICVTEQGLIWRER